MVTTIKTTQSLTGRNISIFREHQKLALGRKKNSKGYNEMTKSESISRSIRRAKNMINDYAKNTKFDYFLTLTFNPEKIDSTNIDKVKECLSKYNRYLKRHNVKYIEVMEYHKDNKKIHVHALIQGNLPIYVNDNKHESDIYWSLKNEWGFSSIKRINHDKNSVGKIANYITKYMTKALFENYSAKKYYCSKGLPTSEVIEVKRISQNMDSTILDMLRKEYGYIMLTGEYVKDNIIEPVSVELTDDNSKFILSLIDKEQNGFIFCNAKLLKVVNREPILHYCRFSLYGINITIPN